MTAPATIDSRELRDRLSSPAPPRILDVRTAGEFDIAHIAGASVFGPILGSIGAPKLKWLAAGVGGGLTFAAVSNSCAMGMLLSKLPHVMPRAS